MAKFCVNIGAHNDKTLEFFGYRFIRENDEFKVYQDKHLEDHIVAKARPLLYVEDVNDAAYLAANEVVALPDDIEDHC